MIMKPRMEKEKGSRIIREARYGKFGYETKDYWRVR